jgi:hypothetical protein
MKTKPCLLLFAVLALGTAPLHAGIVTDPFGICGGADDDQLQLPPPPPRVFLCGGADDDQNHDPTPGVLTPDFDALWNQAMGVPEHKGLLTDPLGIPPPPQGQPAPSPVPHPLDRISVEPILGLLTALHGDEDNDTLTPAQADLYAEINRIVGGDGADFNNPARRDAIADYLFGYLMRRPDFATICGGNGNDSIVLVDEPWWLTLIYGETGSDSLWGGGGTDELREKPIDRPLEH